MSSDRDRALSLTFALAFASGTTFGCNTSDSCGANCLASPDDAGDAATEPELPPCPIQRMCPHVKSVGPMSVLPLGDGNTGNVYLREAIYTSRGPAVSWVVFPQTPQNGQRYGVALLFDEKVAAFDDLSNSSQPVAPALFERKNELGLVGPSSFDQVVPIALDTFEVGPTQPLPLPEPVLEQAAFVGVGQAVAGLFAPDATLSFFDSTLTERLVDIPLGEQSYGSTLARTCNGLIASWSSGAQRAAAFDLVGNRRGPVSSVSSGGNLFPEPAGIWDGASLVLPTSTEIVELDNSAHPRAKTPTPYAEAAIGTDDGVLAMRFVDGHGELVLLERETGTTLESYDVDDGYLTSTVVALTDRYVYFIGTGGFNDSAIHWVSIECGQ